MELSVEKKAHVFRLPSFLLDKLKELARKDRRSLNNYVEGILLDAVYHEPNETTMAAMKEVESGVLKHVPDLDLSSIEAMERSMDL